MERRDWLKVFATVPFLGGFAYSLLEKISHDKALKENILGELNLRQNDFPDEPPTPATVGQTLNIGIIGFGFRGEQLARAAGYAHPDWLEEKRQATIKNPKDTTLKDFLEQESIQMNIAGICDVFDVRAERGLVAANDPRARRYRDYREMLNAPDIDGVIIATPDHWHARMAIDAARAGKHVYLEKCMTRTVEEAVELRNAVKQTGIVFQLGHTGRQSASYLRAREIIEKNILGPITLVQTNTNRNSPFAAWLWPVHPKASPDTIDWKQFLGPAPDHPFDPERFFQWRRWWEYGTGMSGDLLTHEFDAINMIMRLGIPKTATASGGIYYFRDGRTVPDVFHASLEYPDRHLTLLYSGTMASGMPRRKMFMGHDASMEVARGVTVNVDPQSTRYKKMLEQGVLDTDLPLVSYRPGQRSLDAVTSATEKYFADRGLQYTYRGGRRVDTTTLHIAEWLDCIRNGGRPSCNVDEGFQEAITAHMATLSFQRNRTVTWDAMNERVV